MITWRKTFLIGSNLKMYKTIFQTLEYLKGLETQVRDLADSEMHLFILPPFTSLQAAISQIAPGVIQIGAQNMGWEDEGQFTGEISPVMLEEVGARLVMVGHSERRHVLGETDAMVRKKVCAGLRHGFTVLICVGETREEKELGIGPEKVRQQIKQALKDVEETEMERIWLAYEPVWAIGVGSTPATPEYANDVHALIRTLMLELYPRFGKEVPILYGGSVNSENAVSLIRQPEVDGLFIGRSAWQANSFSDIIHSAYTEWKRKQSLSQQTKN